MACRWLLPLAHRRLAIENRLHYVPDVTFEEDVSAIRRGSAPEVTVALRSAGLALLRRGGVAQHRRGSSLLCVVSRESFALTRTHPYLTNERPCQWRLAELDFMLRSVLAYSAPGKQMNVIGDPNQAA